MHDTTKTPPSSPRRASHHAVTFVVKTSTCLIHDVLILSQHDLHKGYAWRVAFRSSHHSNAKLLVRVFMTQHYHPTILKQKFIHLKMIPHHLPSHSLVVVNGLVPGTSREDHSPFNQMGTRIPIRTDRKVQLVYDTITMHSYVLFLLLLEVCLLVMTRVWYVAMFFLPFLVSLGELMWTLTDCECPCHAGLYEQVAGYASTKGYNE